VCPITELVRQRGPVSLVECFARVPDRRGRRGRIHPLPVVLCLSACAITAGHSTPTEIGEWCQDASQELLAALGARYDALTGWYQAPGKDTVTRVLAGIDGDILDAAVCAFQAEIAAGVPHPRPRDVSTWPWTAKCCVARAQPATRRSC
jgi:hypothetical protein